MKAVATAAGVNPLPLKAIPEHARINRPIRHSRMSHNAGMPEASLVADENLIRA